MGMIVTKQIIEASNGILDYISFQNIGSTFVFTFEVEVLDESPVSSKQDLAEEERGGSLVEVEFTGEDNFTFR